VRGHEQERADDMNEDNPSVHGHIVGWLSRARPPIIG
jgi:hypothetical protein